MDETGRDAGGLPPDGIDLEPGDGSEDADWPFELDELETEPVVVRRCPSREGPRPLLSRRATSRTVH